MLRVVFEDAIANQKYTSNPSAYLGRDFWQGHEQQVIMNRPLRYDVVQYQKFIQHTPEGKTL